MKNFIEASGNSAFLYVWMFRIKKWPHLEEKEKLSAKIIVSTKIIQKVKEINHFMLSPTKAAAAVFCLHKQAILPEAQITSCQW